MRTLEPHTSERRRSRPSRVGLLVLVTISVIVAAYFLFVALRPHRDAGSLIWLRSDDPGQRQLGAWLTADRQDRQAAEFIAGQLHHDREPVAEVRASYAQSLGSFGAAEHFPIVVRLLDDQSGRVRQAVWLAAARIDAASFRELAESRPARDDPWDRIGLAAAWLHVGQTRGVAALLRWADQGNPAQQLAACGGLQEGLIPLLEAAGRRPPAVDAQVGQVWSPNLLAEIEQRCSELDLQRIADHVRLHRGAARRLERDAQRMTSARNWIARLLLSF